MNERMARAVKSPHWSYIIDKQLEWLGPYASTSIMHFSSVSNSERVCNGLLVMYECSLVKCKDLQDYGQGTVELPRNG